MNLARSATVAVLGLTLAVRSAESQYPGRSNVPRAVLARYVGEYVYPAGNTVDVRLKGDTLYRETRGQIVPLIPISETRFAVGPVFTAEFVIDKAGGVAQILTDGVETEFRLRRKGDPVAQTPPSPSAVPVSRSVLERYVGVYEFLPGQMSRTDFRVVVRLRGDSLTRQIGDREMVLTPITETRFSVGGTLLETEFIVDPAGVTQVMGSGSQQMKARKPAPAQAGPLDTPASKAVHEWLDAFNSADSTKLRAYYDRYRLTRSMKGELDFRQQTGGFDLVSIEKSMSRYIEFVVKERAREIQAFGVVELNPEGTPGAKLWALKAIPAGKQLADLRIDAARRASVIERVIQNLDNEYVFSGLSRKMGADLRARLNRGEYDDVTNGITFAARLTEHLRDMSHDKHLGVNFAVGGSPQGSPPAAAANGPASCGFTATVDPKGNVGLVRFNGFVNLTPQCGGEATKAIAVVADADALIFDLRENTGGDAAMVAFISGYLFDKPTHLNDVLTRRRDQSGKLIVPDEFFAHESWTSEVPGRKYGGTKPVYVLTSNVTFSAAEEFTYNLKALKRATIVGEPTGGGAHPVRPAKIDDQFSMGVPFARSVNPITKTNWEGTGVTPDLDVPAARALETAKELIARKAKVPGRP